MAIFQKSYVHASAKRRTRPQKKPTFASLSLPRSSARGLDCEVTRDGRYDFLYPKLIVLNGLDECGDSVILITLFYKSESSVQSTNTLYHFSSSSQPDQNIKSARFSTKLPWVLSSCGWYLMTSTSQMQTFGLSW